MYFDDVRGTLFFEIARITDVRRLSYLLENVPKLLSHDDSSIFAIALGTLSELEYHVACQVINIADFGVDQFRKKVFIIGFFWRMMFWKKIFFHRSKWNASYKAHPRKTGKQRI